MKSVQALEKIACYETNIKREVEELAEIINMNDFYVKGKKEIAAIAYSILGDMISSNIYKKYKMQDIAEKVQLTGINKNESSENLELEISIIGEEF